MIFCSFTRTLKASKKLKLINEKPCYKLHTSSIFCIEFISRFLCIKKFTVVSIKFDLFLEASLYLRKFSVSLSFLVKIQSWNLFSTKSFTELTLVNIKAVPPADKPKPIAIVRQKSPVNVPATVPLNCSTAVEEKI